MVFGVRIYSFVDQSFHFTWEQGIYRSMQIQFPLPYFFLRPKLKHLRRFLQHKGMDIKGMASAICKNFVIAMVRH